MSFNKEFYGKECESYTFTWIFASPINLKDCLEKVKENFEHYIGLRSVACSWEPREENGQQIISGSFDAIRKKQHQLNQSFVNHECGDFPMGFCPITRVRQF